MSLWGTSPNIASLPEVRHVGLTGTWGLFDKAAACGLDHGFSQPCATFTLKRAHAMSCLIHDSRLTSAIDLGHTLPPCLSPYQASSASSLLLLVMCIYASMHRSCLDGEPRLGVALAFTGARTCPHARSNARPVSACRGLATVAVVQKPRKARDVGLPWYIPGFETRVRIPGVTAVCSYPGYNPGSLHGRSRVFPGWYCWGLCVLPR